MPDNTPETGKRLAQRIRSDLDSVSAFPLGPDERRFTREDETIALGPVIREDGTIAFVPVTREDETIAFGPDKAADLVDIGMDLVDAIEIAGFSGIAARLARNCEEALKELALYDDDESLLHIITVHHLIGEYLQRIADELDGNAPEPIQHEPAIDAGKDSTNKDKKTGRRGRLPKEEADIKRTAMLAELTKHQSLKDDPAKLARMVDASESTIRRWLAEEEEKYRNCKAAKPDPDDK